MNGVFTTSAAPFRGGNIASSVGREHKPVLGKWAQCKLEHVVVQPFTSLGELLAERSCCCYFVLVVTEVGRRQLCLVRNRSNRAGAREVRTSPSIMHDVISLAKDNPRMKFCSALFCRDRYVSQNLFFYCAKIWEALKKLNSTHFVENVLILCRNTTGMDDYDSLLKLER